MKKIIDMFALCAAILAACAPEDNSLQHPTIEHDFITATVAPRTGVRHGASVNRAPWKASVQLDLNDARQGTMRITWRNGVAETRAIDLTREAGQPSNVWAYREFRAGTSAVINRCRMTVTNERPTAGFTLDQCTDASTMNALDSGVRRVPSPVPADLYRPAPCRQSAQPGACILDFCVGSYEQAAECRDAYTFPCDIADYDGDSINDITGQRCPLP